MAIVDGLPEDKTRELADFARLLQPEAGDREGEHVVAERRPCPKREPSAAVPLRAGTAEPLDPSKHRRRRAFFRPKAGRVALPLDERRRGN